MSKTGAYNTSKISKSPLYGYDYMQISEMLIKSYTTPLMSIIYLFSKS